MYQIPTSTLIEGVLYEIVLPPAPYSSDGYWSRKKAAAYLGLNRETLQNYLDNICTAIPDFRQDIRLHPETLEPIQGFQLTPYQMWVAIRITNFMRALNRLLNGRKYLSDARKIVFQYRHHFSREVFKMHQDSDGSSFKQIAEVA
jgi:hypothetical protein